MRRNLKSPGIAAAFRGEGTLDKDGLIVMRPHWTSYRNGNGADRARHRRRRMVTESYDGWFTGVMLATDVSGSTSDG